MQLTKLIFICIMFTSQMTYANTKYQEILNFWFDENNKSMWFKKDIVFDKKIIDKFENLYKQASNGELSSWLDTPESSLALIILLDQFPRNMFRNSPKAFASDNLALTYAKLVIKKNYDKKISSDKLAFLYMPFMHSEKLADQNQSVALFGKTGLTKNLEYAKEHREIIVRFGRFPHRNAILQRKTTDEEDKFLKEEHSGY